MIALLVALIIFGVVLYLIELIPLDPTVKQIIRVLAILIVVLWVLQLFTGYPSLEGLPHVSIR